MDQCENKKRDAKSLAKQNLIKTEHQSPVGN